MCALVISEGAMEYFVWYEDTIKEGQTDGLLTAQILNSITRAIKLMLDIYVIIKFKQLFMYFLNIKKQKLKQINRHLTFFNKKIIKLVIALTVLQSYRQLWGFTNGVLSLIPKIMLSEWYTT
jgi:hypothetical protein